MEDLKQAEAVHSRTNTKAARLKKQREYMHKYYADPAKREARLQNRRKYFEEHPEKKKKHIAELDEVQQAERRQHDHEYYLKNKKRIYASHKKYRETHKEKLKSRAEYNRAYYREWNKKHPEKRALYMVRYYNKHPYAFDLLKHNHKVWVILQTREMIKDGRLPTDFKPVKIDTKREAKSIKKYLADKKKPKEKQAEAARS